jgi:hypothetical protein
MSAMNRNVSTRVEAIGLTSYKTLINPSAVISVRYYLWPDAKGRFRAGWRRGSSYVSLLSSGHHVPGITGWFNHSLVRALRLRCCKEMSRRAASGYFAACGWMTSLKLRVERPHESHGNALGNAA